MRYNEIIKIPSILIKEGEAPEGAKYTIAIPTYKRANLLKEAIESCLTQKTTTPFAIIVVDNNPERECETEQLLREYNPIPNLSYYKNTENVGMTGNWNKLFELAQTDFVVMLHDDDLLYDDYIEKMDKIINFYKNDVDAVYPGIEIFTHNKNSFKRQINGAIKGIRLHPYDFQFGNTCNIAGVCFSRKSIIEENGFDDYFYPSLDYEMHVRLSKKNKAIKLFGVPLVLYRISENESIKTKTILNTAEKDKEIITSIIRKYPSWYKKLFISFFKAYPKYMLLALKNKLSVTDQELEQKIIEYSKNVTLMDIFILKVMTQFKIKCMHLFRTRTLIK
ncbi:glycosyltransferase family 2 protein [Capnocytophaga sputigena]|jgi:glycosyltransferase, group 2 family|uniref:glycosyltransferase family 2 protein n=1 Tax=Capnocytophaga sputigena TaxID=1019 RepID=UPI0028895EDD|nr:glycosyltransferase family 2 protein [Capnocytophaga sputigena]